MCIESTIKWLLIIANVIFALAGITITALGITVKLQVSEVQELLPEVLDSLAIYIIVLGVIVFIISYLACCGAYKESGCMLLTYAVLMAGLAALKIYLIVVIFGFLGESNTTVAGWLEDGFGNQNLRPAYNALQSLFKCCGTTGPDSYTGVIPQSCCAVPVNNVCQAADSYTGCIPSVSSYFDTFGGVIGGILITVVNLELLCVFFGIFLACVITRRSFN